MHLITSYKFILTIILHILSLYQISTFSVCVAVRLENDISTIAHCCIDLIGNICRVYVEQNCFSNKVYFRKNRITRFGMYAQGTIITTRFPINQRSWHVFFETGNHVISHFFMKTKTSQFAAQNNI